MARLRSKLYNHLNVTSDADNYTYDLDDLNDDTKTTAIPIDTDDQEELINKLRQSASSQTRTLINYLSIVVLIPLPFYIANPALKRPVLCLLSILSILSSAISLRFAIGNDSGIVQSWLHKIPLSVKTKERSLTVFSLIVGVVLLLVIKDELIANVIFAIPIFLSISTTGFKYWIQKDSHNILGELDKLERLKYKFKSV